MESDEALGLVLKVGTGIASYEEVLQYLVELAVSLSTGHRGKSRKSPAKTPVKIVTITKPEYIVAAPHALESVTLNPKKKGVKRLVDRHRANGKIIVPYRYTAYYDGEQLTLAEGNDLPDKLCECLHEKRHSWWREGGLHGTRLNANYFSKNRKEGDRVADAGLIEEAACDEMAHYDMVMLSFLSEEPILRRMLRNEVRQHRRSTTEQRRLIRERKRALAKGEPGGMKARLLLLRFGDWVSPTDEESRLYERLERAVRRGRDERAALLKKKIAEILASRQPEAAEMVLRGECDLEDVLHCQMAHYSHYANEVVEPRVAKLMRFIAPPPAEAAAGKVKNPFIDLVGIHAGLDELKDTLAYARRVVHMGEARILSETGKESGRLHKKRIVPRYKGLRHLYVLAATARRKGIDLQPQLAAVSKASFPRSFRKAVGRLSYFFTKHSAS